MSIEKIFIKKSFSRARLEEFLENELEEAGYGGSDLNRTPMGTRITIYAERPGVVIGRGGKSVRGLTDKLETEFGIENPQIEVSEVEVPEYNAKIMANRIAFLLSRGMYFRRVGYSALQRIMDAGALGVEIIISGKLTGDYAREERFYEGYLKKAGDFAERYVSDGKAVASLPAGTVGVRVKIMPPGVEIPGGADVKKKAEKKESEVKKIESEPDTSEVEEKIKVEEKE